MEDSAHRRQRQLCATVAVAAMLGAALACGLEVAAAVLVPRPNAPIGFRLFPASSPWNADVSALPVDPRSDAYLASIGLATPVHADFGTVWNGAPNGIPYVLVGSGQPKVPVTFYYAEESDPGPYPVPPNPPIEGGPHGTGDRHILTLDVDGRRLYELYDARWDPGARRWRAGSGVIWDLNEIALRPDGWTSADAAGLPILPGLVRYDEVASGRITHALRVTVPRTQRAYRYPATHFASSSTDTDLPPMGLRLRLRADYDVSGFPREVRVVLTALKRYGMIVADNGGPLYISGAPDSRWDDDALHAIAQVTGSDFEVVDTRAIEPRVPLISAGRPATIRRGSSLTRWGCFADPRGRAWKASVDYGDGTGARPLALTGDHRFRLAHRYVRAGTYTLTIRVWNGAGAAGVKRLRVVVR